MIEDNGLAGKFLPGLEDDDENDEMQIDTMVHR
jgi:hypothetical protein